VRRFLAGATTLPAAISRAAIVVCVSERAYLLVQLGGFLAQGNKGCDTSADKGLPPLTGGLKLAEAEAGLTVINPSWWETRRIDSLLRER
jgi:hypothetical protein